MAVNIDSGGFFQILIELLIIAISLRTLPKRIKWSAWLVGLYQPEYMSYVLSGGRGDVSLKAFRNFPKPPRQHERLVFIPLWERHQSIIIKSHTQSLNHTELKIKDQCVK